MNVGTICTTATKIIIVLLGACLIISALSLIVSADTLATSFTWTSAVIGDWHSELNLTYNDISNTPDYVINPFIPRSYSTLGVITPVTRRYQHYGIVTRTNTGRADNGSTTLNVSTTNISDVDIAVNTVTFELCLPSTVEQPVDIENNSFAFRYGSNVVYPSHIDMLHTDAIIGSDIAGAPVQDQFTYSYQITLYFDEIIRLPANSYFTFTLPINTYSFLEPFPLDVGLVWGYDDIVLEYYQTYEEAQNAVIINSLTKYPNRSKYESDIEKNESLADSMSEAGEFEQSLYDNLSIADGLPAEFENNVGIIFGEMAFFWQYDWVITLIIAGIGLAVLSYALYGGS